jgi:hypothetical protein
MGLLMSALIFMVGTVLPATTSISTHKAIAQSAEQLASIPHWRPSSEPPVKEGCFHYTEQTGWIEMACIPDSQINKDPKNLTTIGGTSGIYGPRLPSGNPELPAVKPLYPFRPLVENRIPPTVQMHGASRQIRMTS